MRLRGERGTTRGKRQTRDNSGFASRFVMTVGEFCSLDYFVKPLQVQEFGQG